MLETADVCVNQANCLVFLTARLLKFVDVWSGHWYFPLLRCSLGMCVEVVFSGQEGRSRGILSKLEVLVIHYRVSFFLLTHNFPEIESSCLVMVCLLVWIEV